MPIYPLLPPDDLCKLDIILSSRQQLHACMNQPSEVIKNSDLIATKLKKWGYEVHAGINNSGITGTLWKDNSLYKMAKTDRVAVQPILLDIDQRHLSAQPGIMRAHNFNGHTTILLFAAKHIANTHLRESTLHLIFQPTQDGLSQARTSQNHNYQCDAISHRWCCWSKLTIITDDYTNQDLDFTSSISS
ncbi:hypothetical protein LQR30_16845 [Chromobacterium piscinae]|uniref:hypothetical protein n=1 Tax=Chromobacterium piscinae TaxID=686831 RepID=UPI001E5EB042|nr:hypothetical protein [Chromobacterium piscinae]MCD4505764.1 hypothetical protein [Chromobacterium piscinae]